MFTDLDLNLCRLWMKVVLFMPVTLPDVSNSEVKRYAGSG
jgi:hypothetical protein